MSKHFAPIGRHAGLPEEIATTLSRAIAEGELKPGDRLPTEQKLASSFGVARTVVREAFSQLRYDGLIHSRQGVGAFVAPVESRTVFRISSECFGKRLELLKLLQLRTGVVSEAAGLAALHRSQERLAALEDFLDEMRQSVTDSEGGPERRVDAEQGLYSEIAQAANNEYIIDFVAMIDGRINRELRTVVIKNAKAAEWSADVLTEHERVVAAVRTQDAEAATQAARDHCRKAAERLARRGDLADV